MFLYQTTDIYDKEGNGPFKGLVAKTTPNGYRDMGRAEVGETVVFLAEKEAELEVNKEFEVGEEKTEEEED